VHPQHVDNLAPVTKPHSGPDRLPPLERLRPPAPGLQPAQRPGAEDDPFDASSFDVPVLDGGPSAVITVRYALDEVARTWVAHVFDAQTGDLLKEVPSTEYHHQVAKLAALRHRRSVDALA
jgi:hypothetical protein